MPGPPPKPEGQRRNHSKPLAGQTQWRLPIDGREGTVPPWPAGRQPNKREKIIWLKLWHTPQALMWEKLGWYDTVGRYTRLLALTEIKEPKVGLLMETRQLEDRLGLTPMSMLRLRWAIDDNPEIGASDQERVVDIRDRLAATE